MIKAGIIVVPETPAPLTVSEAEAIRTLAMAVESVAQANEAIANSITAITHITFRGDAPDTIVQNCTVSAEGPLPHTPALSRTSARRASTRRS